MAGGRRSKKNRKNFFQHSPKFRDEASSDKEDDALGHHDLVVILHPTQGSLDLCRREGLFFVLVDGFCESIHAHRLCMSFPEHIQESHLECLQPGLTQLHLLGFLGLLRVCCLRCVYLRHFLLCVTEVIGIV